MKFQAMVKQQQTPYDKNRIGIQTKEGIEMIVCRDILRCEAHKSRCTIHLVNGRALEVKRHLGFYEEKLVGWNFFKVHKSHLVNMQHVLDYVEDKESYVLLSNQTTVPVSVRRRNILMKRVKFASSYLALKEKLENIEYLKRVAPKAKSTRAGNAGASKRVRPIG